MSSNMMEEYYLHCLKRKPAPTRAKLIAFTILHDIESRSGFGNAWESIEADIQEDILTGWVDIIEKQLHQSAPINERKLTCGCVISGATIHIDPDCPKHNK